MLTLSLSIVIFSIGVAAVLYVRPPLLFNADGSHKEFGYQRGPRYTLFPFWLFSVTWAIVSYSFAVAILWGSTEATVSTVPVVAAAAFMTEDEGEGEREDEGEGTTEEVRRPRGRPRKLPLPNFTRSTKKPTPGFYVLDKTAASNGVRKYIYYGSERPEDVDAEDVFEEEGAGAGAAGA